MANIARHIHRANSFSTPDMMQALIPIAMTIAVLAFPLRPVSVFSQSTAIDVSSASPWYWSFQYLGVTYHPDGGTTPEVYPLKLDPRAFVVLNVGIAGNLDYTLNHRFFLRATCTLYKDCAFVTAGGIHLGPRVQFSWPRDQMNIGVGPIFCFREDWHQFEVYTTDDFYGERVNGRWQYRFFPYALELEYLHKLNERLQIQYSLIPGAPLVMTSMIGLRFRIRD